MHITVLGAGGLGAMLGGWLARAGCEVALIFRRQAHVDAINERGLILIGKEEFIVQVHATTDPSELNRTDLLLVCVKNKDTEHALSSIAHMKVGCAASLQNSLLKDQFLAQTFGHEKVIGASSFTGGILYDFGKVSRENYRSTYFGELEGSPTERIQKIVDTFNGAGLNALICEDVVCLEWSKQAWWVPQSVLSVLTRLPFVQVYLRPDLARLVVIMTREIAKIAETCGSKLGDYPELDVLPLMTLPMDQAIAHVQAKGVDFVKQGMGEYLASMLRDVLTNRPTELHETAGAIVTEAQQRNMPIPNLEFAYRTIRGIEQDFEA